MDKIFEILSQIRPEIDYRCSSDYIADGLLDSFDIVTLVSDLDTTFGICIPGTEITPEHFRNAKSISDLVDRYRKDL
jgi:acyl carrier protein